MSNTHTINYARVEGIFKSELAGAVIIAVAYVPLFIFNVFRSIRHPTYVLIVLALFCSIRIAAFIMRALLAASDSAGENLNLVIAESIVYSVGFFGLLYSAYTLVLDRQQILGYSTSGFGLLQLLRRVMRQRHLVRLTLTVAIVLGIVGGTKASSSDPSTLDTSMTLRRASIYIFLVVTIMLVLTTADLAWDEHQAGSRVEHHLIGRKYSLYVLTIIVLLCLVRESFLAATSTNTKQANNAHLFYPLAALPELLAVCLFAVPGLVPSRAEIARQSSDRQREAVEFARVRGSDSSV